MIIVLVALSSVNAQCLANNSAISVVTPPPGFQRVYCIASLLNLVNTSSNAYFLTSIGFNNSYSMWHEIVNEPNDPNNAQGIYFNGQRVWIELAVVDIGYDSVSAANAVNSVLNGVATGWLPDLIFTPFSSAYTLQVATLVRAQNPSLPMIGAGSSGDGVFICQATDSYCNSTGIAPGKRKFNNLFTTLSPASIQFNEQLALISLSGGSSVYVVSEAEPYSTAGAAGIISTASDLGFKVLHKSLTTVGKTARAAEIAQEVMDNDIDALILPLNQFPTCSAILTHLNEAGWLPKSVSLGTCGTNKLLPTITPDHDYRYFSISSYWNLNLRGADYTDNFLFPPVGSVRSAQIFAQKFAAKFGYLPGYAEGASFASAYAVHLALRSLTAINDLYSPNTVAAAISSLYLPSYYGRIAFTSFGMLVQSGQVITQINQNYAPQLITPLTSAQIRMIYPIPQYSERIFMNDVLSSTTEKVMAALTCVGLLYIALITLFVCCFFNSVAIRSATRSFCLVILLGNALALSSNFAWSTSSSPASCRAFVWLICLGFNLIFVPLFTKTFRLIRIFQARHFQQSSTIKNEHMWRFLAIMLGIEIFLLLIWQFAVSPQIDRVILSPDELRPALNYTACTANIPLVIVQLVFKAILLLIGSILAFKARKLPENYNEAKPIQFSLHQITLAFAIVIPLLASSSVDQATKYLIRSLVLLIITVSMVSVLFLPKIIDSTQKASSSSGAGAGEKTAASTVTRNTKSGASGLHPAGANLAVATAVVELHKPHETVLSPSNTANGGNAATGSTAKNQI
jgi:hypothetical protein